MSFSVFNLRTESVDPDKSRECCSLSYIAEALGSGPWALYVLFVVLVEVHVDLFLCTFPPLA